MFRIILFGCFLLFLEQVTSLPNPVDPPVMHVTNSDDAAMNKKYDVRVRKYTQVVQVPVSATSTNAKTTSSAAKRDVNTNLLDDVPTLSTFEENLLDEQGDDDLAKTSCAFTFTLPNPIPRNQQICVTDVRAMMSPKVDDAESDEGALTTLRDDVSRWQESMEDLKSQIEEQLALPGLEPVRNEVRMLQKESRNMNFRISQLYMQLLHEIIRKRDDTIEYTRMENDILNITVKYYELKDRHNGLISEHKILQQKSEAQQVQIEYLQQRMEEITNQMNRASLKAEEAFALSKAANDRRLDDARYSGGINSTIIAKKAKKATSFVDCIDIQRSGNTASGIFSLTLPSLSKKIKVWCDFDQDPGGWIVIQRRSGGSVNFYRNMASYQRGFGKLDGDFWLGLDNIHLLTTQPGKIYKLHIDMEDWSGRKRFAEYASFKIGGEEDGFRLKIAHYSGSAGDSLTWHNNMKFSARNVDSDLFPRNCAYISKGGWWYNACANSNLNGIYYVGGLYRSKFRDGVYWRGWRGVSYSLKKVEMKIRPNE